MSSTSSSPDDYVSSNRAKNRALHARDGAEHEHEDGLTRVSGAEYADGLHRSGVVVLEVADELLGVGPRADVA